MTEVTLLESPPEIGEILICRNTCRPFIVLEVPAEGGEKYSICFATKGGTADLRSNTQEWTLEELSSVFTR